MKFKPPCYVDAYGEKVRLRRVQNWPRHTRRKGMMAIVQNHKGTGLMPYRDLKPWPNAEVGHGAKDADLD